MRHRERIPHRRSSKADRQAGWLKKTEIQVQKTLIKGAKMLSCPTNTKPQLLSNDRKGNPKCRPLSHFG